MQETSYTDINELLKDLLSRIKKILGKKLMGLYVYGSLVWGDFDMEMSDIDLLAVTSADMRQKDFDALDKMHKNFVGKYKQWEDRLEVAYVAAAALQMFKKQKSQIAIMSPGEQFHIKEAGEDWLLNWYFVRQNSMTLFGPSPKSIIEPISREEFIQAVKAQIKEWRKWIHHDHQRKFQAYAILTMCRALYAYKNAEQVSKRQAALWAKKELPQWSGLIQNALEWREAWRNKNIDDESTFPETVKFVNFVTDQVAK